MDIKLYRVNPNNFNIVPGCRARDWMSPHSYRCIPLTTANLFGWDIINPKDVRVYWNGGEEANDVQVLQGEDIAEGHFGLGSVTFQCGYEWETEPGWQLLINPVPNPDFIDAFCMSALVETDWLKYPWFITMKLMYANKEILIPKDTPLCRVIPIQVAPVRDARIYFVKESTDNQEERESISSKRIELVQRGKGEWTKIYQEKAQFVKLKVNRVEEEMALPPKEPVLKTMDGWAADSHLKQAGIMAIDKYLNDNELDKLIKMWDNLGETSPGNGDEWSNRVKWQEHQTFDPVVRIKLQSILPRLSRFFNIDVKCIQDLHFTIWNKGHEMTPHDDVCDDKFPTRQFALLLYLTDDFEGGEVYFPDKGIIIKPERGLLVAFKGSEVLHGVKMVTSGARITLNGWFDDQMYDGAFF
jgi:hypothetical protein